MSSLETIKIYMDENLDEYREIIITQLDDIFADARRKGEKEKEEKAKAKKSKGTKNQVLTISKSVFNTRSHSRFSPASVGLYPVTRRPSHKE